MLLAAQFCGAVLCGAGSTVARKQCAVAKLVVPQLQQVPWVHLQAWRNGKMRVVVRLLFSVVLDGCGRVVDGWNWCLMLLSGGGCLLLVSAVDYGCCLLSPCGSVRVPYLRPCVVWSRVVSRRFMFCRVALGSVSFRNMRMCVSGCAGENVWRSRDRVWTLSVSMGLFCEETAPAI